MLNFVSESIEFRRHTEIRSVTVSVSRVALTVDLSIYQNTRSKKPSIKIWSNLDRYSIRADTFHR
jgi:hypothetical protein